MKILALSIGLAGLASVATAQAPDAAHNPAIKNSAPHTMSAAAEGANSFTEAQAKGRLMKAGYAPVGNLVKDDKGVWRGMATQHGKKVKVGLDYKGNVTRD